MRLNIGALRPVVTQVLQCIAQAVHINSVHTEAGAFPLKSSANVMPTSYSNWLRVTGVSCRLFHRDEFYLSLAYQLLYVSECCEE